jgi:fibronectin type 3 domain-containing protein
MIVIVKVVSASSVRVSWESIDIPEITNYTVYYSQTGNRERQSEVSVPSSVNSVVIEGLVNNEEYQFQVAVTLDRVIGQRSVPTTIVVALPVTDGECNNHNASSVRVIITQHPLKWAP